MIISYESISFDFTRGGLGSLGLFLLLFWIFLHFFFHDELGVVIYEFPELSSEDRSEEDWDGAHRDQEK